MAIKQLTTAQTEADLEAEIHSALRKAFPWIPDGSIRYQTRFSFTFGKAKIDVDGAADSQAEGRSDILLYWGDKPLAVLELKRKGLAIKPGDIEQGLSYASVIRPRFPLVVVTNGEDVRVLEAPCRPPPSRKVLFVRLPELLASEAAHVLAPDLEGRVRKDPAEAANWLASLSSRLPLGDIIAAHSFVDAAGRSGVPLNLIAALVVRPCLARAGRRHGGRDISGGRLVTRRNRRAPPSDRA